MNRFQSLFSNPEQRVFIPYFTLGDPNREQSMHLIQSVLAAGAQALELGIPFTDPVADGPTNQRAMQRALHTGMNFNTALEMIKEIRQQYPQVPIGLLVYYNLLFRRGLDNAYQALAHAGVDALVCAELPLEEAVDHEAALQHYGIGCVHMVFPNTPLARAKQSLMRSTAFAYVVTRAGTTGACEELATNLAPRLQALRQLHDCPLVVGFGLSKPEHVESAWQAGAQGAIVASRFAEWIEAHQQEPELAEQKILAFMQQLSVLPSHP